MAISLKFDFMGNPEPPSIILANRNGNKLGQLNVDTESIDVKDTLKASEFTFTLNKYIDGKLTNLWNKVVDFKLVYCPEWDLWYSIKVELDEATETVKTVFCTQLGQEELSQIMVYNIEINTEEDIARDDYKISILYDKDNTDASIFHRVMSKAPHYSIAYIDESLKRIQKSFSFDGSSICDVFDEIEEEVGCLVIYNSNSDKNGMPKRDISIYDLYQHCDDCGYREEFISDECPKCHSKNIIDGYGEDTTIFVTADELATEGIQLVTDTDSVKNCFKLEAGDDLMTATIRNCNPNDSDYIWYFSDAVKEDMSKELVEAIESYDSKYKKYYDTHISNLDESLVSGYNALVTKYKEYYNTPSTCINCDYKGEFENECPSCHSGNILTGKSLQSIDTPITGYSALMNAYYNTIDLALYLESGLMPNVEMSDTKADEQVKLLTTSSLSPVAVNVEKIDNVSLATANSAVLSMAKVIVRPTYKVEINTSTLSDDKIWSGQFIVTNYSDETDTATSDTINVTINNEIEKFIKQKIEKALNKENTDDLSISGLFDEDKYDYNAFCAELKKYALNPLKSFYDACDACLSILTEQGAGDKNEKKDLYDSLYEPYYRKSQAIANEIKIREDEIAIIEGVYEETDEENKRLLTKGLQSDIVDCRKEIQDVLNFEEHLGKDLWLELCAYRREDKYSNSNYVSDGLNNAELFERALEFVEVAENEIFKSAELQHSISATLNNLLAIPKFKPLIKYFKTGNWIRVRVDDRIFKLRLLEYEFSYNNLESIPVEFSDVTKIKNGTTDVQDIFSQAASMASSYDSVQRQAKKGDVARNTIDQWLVDGLNNANVEIKNNNSEEVLLTKNGLLARSYSDITGTYSPEQLKITHNIMAYTDDNWETVRQSIGKHGYKYFDPNEEKLVDKIGYGMNADFANAAVLCGSQMIGGDIYSNNYSKTVVDGEIVTTGSHIDLEEGHFSLAGGKLKYDGGDLTIVGKIEVTTSGRIGCWDINETSIYKGSAAFGDANGMYFGTNGLSISDTFEVTSSGAATMTGATITGIINAEEGGTIAGFNIGNTSIYNGTNSLTSTVSGIYLGTDGIRQYSSKDANVTISNGILNANGANISGKIIATTGSFTNGTFDNCTINNTCTISGELSGATGTFSGTVSASTIKGSTIEGGSLLIGDEDGYHSWISEDGILNANGVNISGTINAINGTIGGCTINTDGSIISANNKFQVKADGTIEAADGIFTGDIYATGGEIGDFTISNVTESGNTYSGLTSSTLSILPNHIFFKTQSYLNLGNFVYLQDKTDATEIYTSGVKDFKIQNADGGGLKFMATPTNEQSTKNLYVNVQLEKKGAQSGNMYRWSHNLKVSLTAGNNNGEVFLSPITVLLYIGYPVLSWGAYKWEYKTESVTLEAGHHTQSFSFQLASSENTQISDEWFKWKIDENSDYGTQKDFTIPNKLAEGNNNKVYSLGSFLPDKNNEFFLGNDDYQWKSLVVGSFVQTGSDRKIKKDIDCLEEKYGLMFDKLSPVKFKYIDGDSDRYHIGFIAQDVELAIEKSGLTNLDFAGLCISSSNNKDDAHYTLRYEEFIALCVDEIQKLKKRVEELEGK